MTEELSILARLRSYQGRMTFRDVRPSEIVIPREEWLSAVEALHLIELPIQEREQIFRLLPWGIFQFGGCLWRKGE
jgi:hypothetical protein